MRITKIALLLLCTLGMNAQAQMSIANARTQAQGTSVTVSGILTNGDELGSIRYMQDSTAGIAIYAPSFTTGTDRGDSVTVTGELKDYNGLLELDPVTAFTVHSSGNALPSPKVVTPNQLDESLESQLVQIIDADFDVPCTPFTSSTHNFTSSNETGIIYVRSGHPLIGSIMPMEPITLTGILSQYSFTGFGGYQMLPRDAADLGAPASVQFVNCLSQSNITQTSFDISWETSAAGSSNLRYGLTENLELGDINNGGSTSTHNVTLPGLSPGKIYYVSAYTIVGMDTVFSGAQPFATASNSSGKIRVYFNKAVDTSFATIELAQHLDQSFDDTLVAYINKAQKSLDMSIYNNNNSSIVTAINNAHNRGVQVRYIKAGSTNNIGLNSLDPNIPVLGRYTGSGNGLMHNKFIIIDADSTENAWVITGSTNLTPNNLFDDPNNLVLIQDQSLAKAYELEFEEMWGSSSAQANASEAKFGADKKDNTPHQFVIGGVPVELYFSPSDRTTSKIEEAIYSADDNLSFALLSFTRNELGTAVMARHFGGADVRGIIENVNDSGSEFPTFQQSGLAVYEHTLSASLHHKYAIIDEGTNSDPMVITGSHNWSSSAENLNDENTLIIHDARVANLFQQEFERRIAPLANVSIEEEVLNALVIYPNPSTGNFNIELPNLLPFTYELIDATGRIIHSGKGLGTAFLGLEGLEMGVYFVNVRYENSSITKPVILSN